MQGSTKANNISTSDWIRSQKRDSMKQNHVPSNLGTTGELLVLIIGPDDTLTWAEPEVEVSFGNRDPADSPDENEPEGTHVDPDQELKEGFRIMRRANRELTIGDFDTDGRLVLYATCDDFKAFSACVGPYPDVIKATIWAKEAFDRANQDVFPNEIPFYLDGEMIKLVSL